MTAVRLPVRQGTPEWLEARRHLITSTAIPVLLGLSPWKSEATLAAEMTGAEPRESTPAMRLGLAMESFVADEYVALTGKRVRRVTQLLRHPTIEWAGASLDREVIGERRAIEIKTSSSRRWEDGVPQDVEAQVQWALGVGGYPSADIVAWHFNKPADPLRVYPLEYDAALFERLVLIAADFRRRLVEGGPFAHDAASLKAAYPVDNGAEMVADGDMAAAVKALVTVRAKRKALEADEERIETAIKGRMGEFASLVGQGFHVTWKRTRDSEQVDWRSVADGLLRQLPEPERAALVGIHTSARPGFRPFRLVWEGDSE